MHMCVCGFVCLFVLAFLQGGKKRFVRLSEWLVFVGEERTRLPSSGTQPLKGWRWWWECRKWERTSQVKK